jgi:hypothetical protein
MYVCMYVCKMEEPPLAHDHSMYEYVSFSH